MKNVMMFLTFMVFPVITLAKTYPATLRVTQPSKNIASGKMTLTSSGFKNFGRLTVEQVNSGFGCSGKNISPELSWSHIPTETKSLVVTAYDPDAPTGSGFWHWSVVNIPPSITALAAGVGNENGQLPDGTIQLKNDGGSKGFTGACPPTGDQPHRYIFTLYALKEKLAISSDVTPAVLGFMLNGKVLAKTQITALYSR